MADSKTVKKVAIGAAIAGAVGYVAGILTAPQSGKETREDIKENVNKGILLAEKELKKLQAELSVKIDEARRYAEELTGKSRAELDKLIAVAKEKKEKVRVMLSAIHEGDADDADLAKAIDEASDSIDHLKKYLDK